MLKEKSSSGISTKMFAVGLILAILASSALSIAIVTQLQLGPVGPAGPVGLVGPAGQQGLQGVQGLQGQIGPQGSDGILKPDYDSGWVEVKGQIVVKFNHNLETSDVFVYVLSKWYRNWPGSGGPLVHQFYYGGDWHGDPERMQGFDWCCYTEDPNLILVSQYGGRADELRVLIWKLAEP